MPGLFLSFHFVFILSLSSVVSPSAPTPLVSIFSLSLLNPEHPVFSSRRRYTCNE
jgi:hypothetical protein